MNHTGDIVADSAEPKSISELQGYGLSVIPAVKGPDSIKFGIDKIKEYPMFITRSSLNFLDEVDSYKWIMKDGVPTNVPKAGHDHLMDASRYGVQLITSPSEPMQVQVQNARKMGFTNVGI